MNGKRGIYLILGCLSMLFGGLLYAWSILKAPFAAAFGWSRSGLALNFTIMMCCFCLGGLLAGFLARRTAARMPLIAAAVLAAAGFALVSLLGGQIVCLYLSYGCLAGLGIGMMYNTVISTVSGWYPEKKGLVTGLLLMCFGASTMVFGTLSATLMDTIGWRSTYRLLALTIGCIFLLTALLLACALVCLAMNRILRRMLRTK